MAVAHDRRARRVWCSVDLRDGNQALIEPMDAERKLRMFELLVEMGFKEIEVGFPAASQTDFDFVRTLIDDGPDPGRRHDPGADAGARAADRAHVRGAARARGARSCTSTTRPRRCSAASCSASTAPGIVDIAVARRATDRASCAAAQPGDATGVFEYSPESFTGTELDFAVEVCDAVTDVWQPTPAAHDASSTCRRRSRWRRRTSTPTRSSGCRRHLARRDGDRAVGAPAQRPRHAASRRPSSR